MFEDCRGIYIYRENAKFLMELSRSVEKLELFQFRMKFAGHDCMADFNIKNKGFEIFSIQRGRYKFIPYLKALWHGFRRIHACDFLYFYYPGNICIILSFFAIFQKKPFGLYVRGEHGISSRISKHLFRRAVVSLTISPKITEQIRQTGGNADTIRPMMDDGEQDIVTDRAYIAKGQYKLLYLGRIELAKGSYDLISAIKIMRDQGVCNVSLDMVGDGADAIRIKKQVMDWGLSEYITFHGTISDRKILRKFYRDADLFILPTHHEGFPRVLYESMIAGVPILTTFVGEISFLMKDGYNCYRISPKNPEEMARKIIAVLHDYEKKAVVAQNGTKTVKSYLSNKKESHATQLVRILNEKGIGKVKK